ncbi:MAG: TerC family protein [Salinibacter sp.]|jgi:Membrane protein TerC, possibly involved in tellurium resistance|uniref:TerC family protein n=1 Tax=Salinibacter sp. TaxID=2065818 RepID=UPI002FC2F32F
MEWIASPEAWIALGALTILEIVLGIDNIVFISILSNKLPTDQQPLARRVGLGLALAGRIALLFSISWVMSLTTPLFSVLAYAFSGRDLILLAGGFFLIGKATTEIHDKLEGQDGHTGPRVEATFAGVIAQIFLLDVVFSLDSVITAVGMAEDIEVMIIAVTIAIAIMMVSAESISSFIEAHPTLKMLALSFLLLIGVTLVAEGLGQHISKGYIYSAMAFSLLVEMLNLSAVRDEETEEPVHLHKPRLRRAVERAVEKDP